MTVEYQLLLHEKRGVMVKLSFSPPHKCVWLFLLWIHYQFAIQENGLIYTFSVTVGDGAECGEEGGALGSSRKIFSSL